MDFGLTESQQMLKASVQSFAKNKVDKKFVREMERHPEGYTDDLWRSLADLGWLRLPFPETYSGDGQDFVTLCALLEEMGRTLVPGPYLTSVVLCGQAIAEFGSEDQKRRFLPAIGNGKEVVVLAHIEPNVQEGPDGIQLTVMPQDSGYVLNGVKLFVPYANSAKTLLVSARQPVGAAGASGVCYFLVSLKTRGVAITRLHTISKEPQYEIDFTDVVVPASAALGQLGKGQEIERRIAQWGAVAACALMSGAAQSMLDLTVDYVKARVAFGRPIGSFQAIQHHCANMTVDVESCKAVTYNAAWYVSERLPADMHVATAKGWVSDALRRVYSLAHQCHGAMGLATEYDLQLYSRRCKAWEMLFGDHNYQQHRVGQLLGF